MRNLTVRLDEETIQRARILAAREGTSISKLVAQVIERLLEDDAAFEAARRRALQDLEKGFHLGGGPPCTRDELHERR